MRTVDLGERQDATGLKATPEVVVQILQVDDDMLGFELPPWGWDLRQRPDGRSIEIVRWRDVPDRYQAELDREGIVRWRKAA